MAQLDRLFQIMVDRKASDLHLTAGEPPMLRIDGTIGRMEGEELLHAAGLRAMMEEICPHENWAVFEQEHDTDFAYELDGVGRFRTNFFRDLWGPGAVMRHIPNEIMTAEDLKLPKSVINLCYLNKGLVLVTGPTGSGKSTTLCAMVDFINRHREDHIITIEDPIEFVHPNKQCLINQREVGVHTDSFKKALRAALREDPDIILVGEMRDLETIALAVEIAETGHLVFGTLHTSTAPSTVDRLIDQFPPKQQSQIRTQLAESLKAVVAQTLCKRRGGGRIAALEILICNTPVSANIREGKTHQIPLAMQTGKRLGMMDLNTSLIRLVRKKIIDPLEAYMKSIEKERLLDEFRRIGIKFERPAFDFEGLDAKRKDKLGIPRAGSDFADGPDSRLGSKRPPMGSERGKSASSGWFS